MSWAIYRPCGICGSRTLSENGICFDCKRVLNEPEKPCVEPDIQLEIVQCDRCKKPVSLVDGYWFMERVRYCPICYWIDGD